MTWFFLSLYFSFYTFSLYTFFFTLEFLFFFLSLSFFHSVLYYGVFLSRGVYYLPLSCPVTNYWLTRPCRKRSDSEGESPKIICSFLEPGTAPRKVQARPLSSSTMVIQWVEPETPNGQVTVSFRNVFALFVQFGPIDFQLSLFPPLLCPLQGYKIYYTTDPNQPMASWKYQMVDNNQLTTISDLDTHTIYTIRVQALTSVGPGPLSTPVQIKTQQGVPSQPEMLTAIDIGETTVTLQWNKPIHSAENILSYELYWNDTYAQVGERSFLPLLLFSPRSPFPLSLSISLFLSLSFSLFPRMEKNNYAQYTRPSLRTIVGIAIDFRRSITAGYRLPRTTRWRASTRTPCITFGWPPGVNGEKELRRYRIRFARSSTVSR